MAIHSRPTHESDLASLLALTARRMRRAQLDSLEPYGITPQLSRALAMIERLSGDGEVRPSSIAARLDISARSATEVVDALEERGLVERHPSPSDRRATALTLTDAGRALRREIGAVRAEQTHELTRHLTGDEQELLRALLTKMLDA